MLILGGRVVGLVSAEPQFKNLQPLLNTLYNSTNIGPICINKGLFYSPSIELYWRGYGGLVCGEETVKPCGRYPSC